MLVMVGCFAKIQNNHGSKKGYINCLSGYYSDQRCVFSGNYIVLHRMQTWKITLRKIAIFPFILVIRIYKLVISPWMGPKCRYTPTCSQYAIDALYKYGMIKGLWKALNRISRCHPWGGSGYDPA
jgi:putative membrane protein insertion efficiency factor